MQTDSDCMMVVLDRLTKMGHLIPVTKKLTSESCAHLISRHVFSLHGFPITIVSSQDKLFRKEVWGKYMELWGIQTRFATKSHPQTDGQTERTIRTISDIMRTVLNKPGQTLKWDELLPMVEFAYNNSVHSAIKTTPFFANYGFHPRFVSALPDPMDAFREKNRARVAAHMFAMEQQNILQQVREMMAESQNAMARDANRHRSVLTFNVGDEVLVHRQSTKLATETGRKFTKLWLGPFKVTKVISDNAYEINLPALLRKQDTMAPGFNVDSLKPFIPLSSEFEPLPPLSQEERLERLSQLEAISDVTESSLSTHWLDSSTALPISLDDYNQFPLDKRLALENAYNSRVPFFSEMKP